MNPSGTYPTFESQYMGISQPQAAVGAGSLAPASMSLPQGAGGMATSGAPQAPATQTPNPAQDMGTYPWASQMDLWASNQPPSMPQKSPSKK